ncbi:ABC transporter substrate-binding protein [Kineosporia babensis]|uniref:Sugar ABC transporter substrate-binding protein n=1 Tax=Kineosporia babensis TaxID=499548 RepID=A0A9X1SWX6_9ACTN|nr:sugar ABC transporter substrate-binding protein [Kineosporia babensis]MCD5315582.1 sugar ABC transporter substrate-binding protein [Kineosporia babensis]
MKRSTPRSLAVLAVAGLSISALAACGSNDGSGNSGGSTDADGNVTIDWSMWSGGTAEKDAWQAAADAVHAADPKITVKLETTSFDDYFTKMGTRIAGGSAPCIVSVQSLRLGALKDGLLPLDDLIQSKSLDTEDFVPASLEGLASDGAQYGIPYDNGPMLMLYNVDRFKEAGVDAPKAGWTWNDFTAAAKALSTDGKFGFAAYPADLQMFPMLLSLSGQQPVSEDGKLQLDNAELQAAGQTYADLVGKDKVAPELSGNDSTYAYNQFIAGNAAMVVDGPWDLLSIQSQSDFQLGAVEIPAGPSGSKTLSAGSGFGISKSCKNPDEAFAAIQTITSTEQLSKLAADGRAFPSRVSAQEPWYDNAFDGAKEALEAAGATAEPMRTTSNWTKVGSDLIQYGVPAMNGTSTVKDTFGQIQSQDAN